MPPSTPSRPRFDHERLDVYRLALEFVAWVGDLLDSGPLSSCPLSAAKHLDESASSMLQNIAEGNGKRSRADRCRFLDISRGSALECAAALDILVVRRRLDRALVARGKDMLERVVAMLTRLIAKLDPKQ